MTTFDPTLPPNETRFQLHREVGWLDLDGRLVFIGCNPSTATDAADDPTTRKLKGFTRHLGYRSYSLGNLSPIRATKPGRLYAHPMLEDAELVQANLDNLREMLTRRDVRLAVPCWGAPGGHRALMPHRIGVRALLRELGIVTVCFGFTKTNQPRHPLMLAYRTDLQEYNCDD